VEPGSVEKAAGFSTAPNQGPYPYGDPRDYAARKAALYSDEGGPAIVEVEVPNEIVARAIDEVAEVRFEPGFGLAELREAWPGLLKRILES
jgi:hypothetical protein